MIKCYTILFIIFSLMCIPIYYLYWSQNGLTGTRVKTNAKLSLGNMGFSESIVVV